MVDRPSLRYYSGRDETVIQTYASEDEPLIILARRTPRRNCELGYLTRRGVQEVDTRPRVTNDLEMDSLSFAHAAVATRIARVLEDDYFLEADIRFGKITGGLPVLVTNTNTPVVIYLDPSSTGVAPLISLYRDDFDAFGPFVKDFVGQPSSQGSKILYLAVPEKDPRPFCGTCAQIGNGLSMNSMIKRISRISSRSCTREG